MANQLLFAKTEYWAAFPESLAQIRFYEDNHLDGRHGGTVWGIVVLVLVAGGFNGVSIPTSQIYNPTTNTWTATGSLNTGRYAPAAQLLPSGRVLVAGGYGPASQLSSAESWNPLIGASLADGPTRIAAEILQLCELHSGGDEVRADHRARVGETLDLEAVDAGRRVRV